MKSSLSHMLIWVCICATTFVGYGFWHSIIANKSIAVENMQNQIDTKIEMVDRIASARTTLADVSGSEIAIQSYFIAETEIVSFIDTLEAYARAQNATMKVLSVSTSKAGTQPTLAFLLTINGTFDAIMRTVGTIEYAPYNLSIAKLSFGKGEKSSWNANVEILVGSMPTI